LDTGRPRGRRTKEIANEEKNKGMDKTISAG
jgi:hypothetical protein